jgi:glucose-6-phosphate dehydrogenase assembly protein OpcA
MLAVAVADVETLIASLKGLEETVVAEMAALIQGTVLQALQIQVVVAEDRVATTQTHDQAVMAAAELLSFDTPVHHVAPAALFHLQMVILSILLPQVAHLLHKNQGVAKISTPCSAADHINKSTQETPTCD